MLIDGFREALLQRPTPLKITLTPHLCIIEYIYKNWGEFFMKWLFVDVDTQRDFIEPDGALYVPGAENLRPVLEHLTDFAEQYSIFIISSVDAHSADDVEFKRFSPHCVVGTSGQKKIHETLLQAYAVFRNEAGTLPATLPQQVIVEKQTFDLFSNPTTEVIIRELGTDAAVVYGVATEYSVKAAALGLLQRALYVFILADAIKGVSESASAKALDELKNAGAKILTTAEILQMLSNELS